MKVQKIMSEPLIRPQPIKPAGIVTASGTKIPLADTTYQFQVPEEQKKVQDALKKPLPSDMLLDDEPDTTEPV